MIRGPRLDYLPSIVLVASRDNLNNREAFDVIYFELLYMNIDGLGDYYKCTLDAPLRHLHSLCLPILGHIVCCLLPSSEILLQPKKIKCHVKMEKEKEEIKFCRVTSKLKVCIDLDVRSI